MIDWFELIKFDSGLIKRGLIDLNQWTQGDLIEKGESVLIGIRHRHGTPMPTMEDGGGARGARGSGARGSPIPLH